MYVFPPVCCLIVVVVVTHYLLDDYSSCKYFNAFHVEYTDKAFNV